ncbi:MAG: sulfatase-like hydrolase/transferase [Acidobacteria bacterium]|nr:sulfatase-like hydrolase/transferase [Acidobacteriota bacterium]
MNYLVHLARHSFLIEIFAHFVVIVCSVGLFAAFVYWALISGIVSRMIYFSIFAVSSFIEYTCQRTLLRFSNAEDIKLFIVMTNAEMQVDALKTFLNWQAIFPCVAFALCLLLFRIPKRSAGLKGLMVVLIGTFGFYLIVAQRDILYKDYLTYPVVSVNACFRTLADYVKISITTPDVIREEVETVEGVPRPVNNIIFVIDESLRGDHLSLNGYARKTTPYLDGLYNKGMLQNWGIATSVTTCSGSSSLILATGLRVQDLPDTENNAHQAPTIFQYAKAMGYRTYFLDGQMNVLWSIKPTDMKYIDEWWGLNRFLQINGDRMVVDFTIAETTGKIITNSHGNFIWVIKSGVHFPYYKRFPEKAAEWTPFFANMGGGEKHQEEFMNSYDNAIKYNLDIFFKSLIPDYRIPDNTTIVYTSDHGETIGEGGNPNFHCGVTKNEVVVPLFIIGYNQTKVDTKYKASHPNIFATLLDMMKVPDYIRKRQYAPSLLTAKEADSEPRYYVGPGLNNRDKLKFD